MIQLYHMTTTAMNWVVEEKLAVSSFPFSERDIVNYKMQDISVIINLTDNISYRKKYPNQLEDMQVYQLPVEDFSVPSLDLVENFVTVVDNSLEAGKKVVVHCIGGCGRTGTLVAIWLYRNLDFDNPRGAIRYLREIRPCSIETSEQENFVIDNA